MSDLDPTFNQRDISDANGPIDTVVDGQGKVRECVDALVQIDTVTADSNTYLLDSNYVYSAAISVNAASSNLDNPIILFKNPSGSARKIYFLEMTGNSTISNERTLFKLFYAPTVTSDGSALTPRSRNVGGGAAAAKALVYTLPTVSADGNDLAHVQSGENTNSQDITSVRQLVVQANQTLLITAKPKSNNRIQAVTMVWAEVPV